MRTVSVLVAFVFGAGCPAFDPSVPPTARILCASDAECPDGLVCSVDDALCVAAGTTPPRVLALSMTGASTIDGVTSARAGVVALDVTADVDLADGAVLLFHDQDPGFVLISTEAATAHFELAIDDTVDDGFFALASVTLQSTAGLRSVTTRDETLRVDRLGPLLDMQVDDDDDYRPFSDEEHNAVGVRFTASEPINEVTLELSGATLAAVACNLDNARGNCSGTISSGAEGLRAADLVLRARDAAGNVGEARRTLPVDFTDPGVLSSEVTIRSPAGTIETSGGPGSTIDIEFVVDEPLASLPVVDLVVGGGVVASAVTVVPRANNAFVYNAVFEVESVEADDTIVVRAELRDVLGHTRTVDPLSTIRVLLARESGCEPVSIDACVDADGDGFGTVACGVTGGDCDDTEPMVHPGAVEVPGDGVRNDCSEAPQEELDDLAGAFVAPARFDLGDGDTGGSDVAGCGTTISPCSTPAFAIAQNPDAPRLLLEGGFSYFEADWPNRVMDFGNRAVIGGLNRDRISADAVVWSRPSTRAATSLSVIAPDVLGFDPPLDYAGPLLDGVQLTGHLRSSAGAGTLYIVRSAGFDRPRGVLVGRRVFVLDGAFAVMESNGGGSRLIDSSFGPALSADNDDVLKLNRQASLVRVDALGDVEILAGDVDISSSLLRGRVSAPNTATGRVRIAFCTLLPTTDGRRVAITKTVDIRRATTALFVGNLMVMAQDADGTTAIARMDFPAGGVVASNLFVANDPVVVTLAFGPSSVDLHDLASFDASEPTTTIGELDGVSADSTFEVDTNTLLPAQGWNDVFGGAQILDPPAGNNGSMVGARLRGDNPPDFANYEVQYATGVAVAGNTTYTLHIDMGFLAAGTGSTADFDVKLGTLEGGVPLAQRVFTPLANDEGFLVRSGSIVNIGNLQLAGTVSGSVDVGFTTPAGVSGDELAVRWAQKSMSSEDDYFGIDNVTLTAVTDLHFNNAHALSVLLDTDGNVLAGSNLHASGPSVLPALPPEAVWDRNHECRVTSDIDNDGFIDGFVVGADGTL